MTSYVFRVWLLPHPPLEFEPDEEVWRDIEVDSSQTLNEFHEAMFEAFDRWEAHTYEFLTATKTASPPGATFILISTMAG